MVDINNLYFNHSRARYIKRKLSKDDNEHD